jgi:hypothetical protein
MKTVSASPLPIFLFYGMPKVGKTTLACEFPDAIYVNTPGESPAVGIDVATSGQVEDFESLMVLFAELYTAKHDRKSVIIDSLDGLEPILWAETCRRNGWRDIEEPGYGKGYVALDEVWREFIKAIEALAWKGVNVVLLAHTETTNFTDVVIGETYGRYEIKLHKRGKAIVQEATSVIGLVRMRTTIKTKEEGFNKKTTLGMSGGDREIYLEERPGFTAGNRFGMPPSISYTLGSGYAELAKYLPS